MGYNFPRICGEDNKYHGYTVRDNTPKCQLKNCEKKQFGRSYSPNKLGPAWIHWFNSGSTVKVSKPGSPDTKWIDYVPTVTRRKPHCKDEVSFSCFHLAPTYIIRSLLSRMLQLSPEFTNMTIAGKSPWFHRGIHLQMVVFFPMCHISVFCGRNKFLLHHSNARHPGPCLACEISLEISNPPIFHFLLMWIFRVRKWSLPKKAKTSQTGGWFQLYWKIWVKLEIFPKVGMKIKIFETTT